MVLADTKLIHEAREEVKRILTEVVNNWDRLKKRTESTIRCCYLSLDGQVHAVSDIITKSSTIGYILQKFLEHDPLYQELWNIAISEVSKVGPEYETWFRNIVARQMTFLLSLSPAHDWKSLLHEMYKLKDEPLVQLTFLDLAESIILQHVLSRSTVAHIYLYGSSRFRKQMIEASEKMKDAGEDFDKFHENMITKKVAPAIYSILSALNLISSVIDEKIASYPVLGKIVVSGGLRAKVTVQTGIGASFSKALLHGIASKTNLYIPGFFISTLIGNCLLAEMWSLAVAQEKIANIVQEALVRHNSLTVRIIDTIKKSQKLSMRELRNHYEPADGVRDAVLAFLLINTAEKSADEIALSDLLRII